MKWYYAINGERQGPVDENGLKERFGDGSINAQTLVWREGMAEWLPLAQSPVAEWAGAASGPDSQARQCVVTGKYFEKAEMMETEHGWVSAEGKSIYAQRLKEGLPPAVGTATAWRDKKLLVVSLENPELPLRCVRTGVELSDGDMLKKKLTYTPPLIYLSILISILITIVLSLIFSKRIPLAIGLSPERRQFRAKMLWIFSGVLVAGIGAIVAAAVLDQPGWIILGVFGILASLIGLSRLSSILYVRKMDKEHAWIGGAGSAFLDTLPEY